MCAIALIASTSITSANSYNNSSNYIYARPSSEGIATRTAGAYSSWDMYYGITYGYLESKEYRLEGDGVCFETNPQTKDSLIGKNHTINVQLIRTNGWNKNFGTRSFVINGGNQVQCWYDAKEGTYQLIFTKPNKDDKVRVEARNSKLRNLN